MKYFVLLVIISQALCEKPVYGPRAVVPAPVRQVSTLDLLRPAHLNFGFNAGYQLPESLPSLTWKPYEIPVPVPDLAAVDIPYPYLLIRPRVNVRTEQVQVPVAQGYH